MITETEYRQAKKIYKYSIALLICCIALLVIVTFNFIAGDHTKWFNLISAIVNVMVFSVISLQNRKKIREYESQETK